jgi:hypothetical protein
VDLTIGSQNRRAQRVGDDRRALHCSTCFRVMMQKRWSAEAWAEVRVEFRKAVALRSEIRRRGGLTSS